MAVILVTYCTRPFYKSALELKKSAILNGVDKVLIRTEGWLKKQRSFYQNNKDVLSNKRGAGYWLWKPFVILETLMTLDDGDTLIYLDAGTTIINNISEIVELCSKKELLLFYNNGNLNKAWTKRDCFYYMNCDSAIYHDNSQLLAGYIFCKKTESNIKLFEEWLSYCQDERLITDNENVCGLPNLKEFIDHRHDQSILTNLAIKYNLELYRDPSHWGNKYKTEKYRVEGEFIEDGYVEQSFINSIYPTILNGHRLKKKLTVKDNFKFYWNEFKLSLNFA